MWVKLILISLKVHASVEINLQLRWAVITVYFIFFIYVADTIMITVVFLYVVNSLVGHGVYPLICISELVVWSLIWFVGHWVSQLICQTDGQLYGWSVGQWVGSRAVDEAVSRSDGWLIGWFVSWQSDIRSVGRLVYRSVGQSVSLLASRSVVHRAFCPKM